MTAGDWLVVALLFAVIAALFIIDDLSHRRDRRIDRADRAAADQRLRREIERQP